MPEAGEALEVRKLRSLALFHENKLSKAAFLLIPVAIFFFFGKLECCS